jgi:NAD(P)-dependent dehydrogenase (short-subunit alcohol dehydrogenase family)
MSEDRRADVDRLKDRVAIVTGAASGIGRAIVQRFYDEGGFVFAVDRNAETLGRLPPDSERWAPHLSDVSIKGASAPLITACVARFGRLDILVNNAGVGNSKPAHETSDEDLDFWINANLSGTFRLSRDALPELRGRKGVILNMASGLGLVGMAKQAAYSSAKAAIIGLTRQMAAEYGPDGVRVNAVAPGLIETPATAERLRSDADYRASNIGSMPLGRAGQPSEVAAAAAFLCSDDASFVTGHILVVDGGMTSTRVRLASKT